mmetsp:Transcript_5626/g.13375  ORF Transcript_5626/g.13375 Transcript_5626/m.13375 type:complete len:335 (-) Transcript_5626:177-1181(-)
MLAGSLLLNRLHPGGRKHLLNCRHVLVLAILERFFPRNECPACPLDSGVLAKIELLDMFQAINGGQGRRWRKHKRRFPRRRELAVDRREMPHFVETPLVPLQCKRLQFHVLLGVPSLHGPHSMIPGQNDPLVVFHCHLRERTHHKMDPLARRGDTKIRLRARGQLTLHNFVRLDRQRSITQVNKLVQRRRWCAYIPQGRPKQAVHSAHEVDAMLRRDGGHDLPLRGVGLGILTTRGAMYEDAKILQRSVVEEARPDIQMWNTIRSQNQEEQSARISRGCHYDLIPLLLLRRHPQLRRHILPSPSHRRLRRHHQRLHHRGCHVLHLVHRPLQWGG